MSAKYRDREHRVYEARRLLGDNYATMRGGHRVKSINLPVRDTLAEAQADLDWWASKTGLLECCPVCHRLDRAALTICPDSFHEGVTK